MIFWWYLVYSMNNTLRKFPKISPIIGLQKYFYTTYLIVGPNWIGHGNFFLEFNILVVAPMALELIFKS